MKVAIRWVVFYCSCLFGGRSSFTSSSQNMKNFPTFSPSLKGSKTTEPKQPHPQGFSFAVLIFWRLLLTSFYPILQTLLENIGIWANGNQAEYLKGYWVVLCSEVVAPVFKYVRRIFGLRLGHQCTLSSYSLWFPVLLGFRIPWDAC